MHWRTASPDVTYGFNHVDPETGWGEWTDEYFDIYPDAVAARYQEIRSTWAANKEWQQTELINQPGTRPEDNVELEATAVSSPKGWRRVIRVCLPGQGSATGVWRSPPTCFVRPVSV